ncbi:carbohydrate kinase family protein [Streptomyces alkaliterrae]|uniref:Carbohydrate kinase n=1 Tax=Streptomyces alkaliterrae TaxID=2213162 RepID=A0A5P0YVP4_9ACTN|nr:carbohydrate kinase [Streptomyces alkaliterrae]MBB1256428.1 carbohydrate kinase [Streptomyces alkaliterrae]MBB1257914.1 carbohydrate kinase [Streptomyces alkaliterrae]MQS04365.1 carbohydrate kinase [Streptomyces alkaliterrae]
MSPQPAGHTVTVLGECVADVFTGPATEAGPSAGPDALVLRALPGGGPANTAVALARLGTPTRFAGRLSRDVFGELFRGRLARSGVDLSACVTAAEASTLALADVREGGQAAYSFHAEGTADWQWSDRELAAASLGAGMCLHTGSLALVREPGGTRVEEHLAAARPHTTISLDPNVRPLLVEPAVYRERLHRWCELADILRLSEEDLAHLLPDATPEEACDTLHTAGAHLVVLTLGERGALLSLDGVRTTVPGHPTHVVDTVGAGDSFTAGLLHHLATLGRLGGRLDALTLDEAVDAATYATKIAAHTCRTPGANPPWSHDLSSTGSAS